MISIVQKEDPVLRGVAQEVGAKEFGTPGLKKILKDMSNAMEKEDDGVAIAAPQIGVPLRIFVVSHRAFEFMEDENREQRGEKLLTKEEKAAYRDKVFINPVIMKLSKKKKWMPEGCLSVRWLYGEVSRSEKATVRAYDENGKAFTYGGSGLMAQIFQHETDHLNGTLFIDAARNVETVTKEEQEERRRQDEQYDQ